MTKLFIYFRENRIGSLVFDGVNYIYIADEGQIQKLQSKGVPLFLWQLEKNFEQPQLPDKLAQFVPGKEQAFLNEQVNIKEQDSDWQKLCKVADHIIDRSEVSIRTK